MTATSIKISFRPRSNRSPRLSRGFTLIELTIALGIIGLLSSIAGSRYLAYIEKVRVASAVASIRAMSVQLDDFVRSDESLPATLSEVGMGDMVDPWGHPFQYLPFTTTSSGSGASGGSAGDSSGSGDSGDSAGSSSGSGDSGTTPDGGSYLGEARKDYFLVPLNSEYDLYSVGKDGESRPPLSVPVSADDVIRANDGAYVGLAANY
jgi:general secretion pathway protein G